MSQKASSESHDSKGHGSEGLSHILLQVQQDPQLQRILILGGLGLFFVIILLIFLSKRRLLSVTRRSVLIVGPCDVGKTTIFSQLVHDRPVDTYTSMIENSSVKSFNKGDDSSSSKTVQLVDLPGFDRLRVAGIEKNKHNTRAILYVVDASNVAKTIADSTEYLFKILSDPIIHKNCVPVLVVCNKSDLDLAKSANLIERELEKEINLLRQTHSNTLMSTDGSVDHIFLGKEGQDFRFSHLPNKVDFCEVSAKSETSDSSTGFNELKKWIYSVA